MYCPECGSQNPDGAKFCNHCGSPLPSAMTTNSPTTNYGGVPKPASNPAPSYNQAPPFNQMPNFNQTPTPNSAPASGSSLLTNNSPLLPAICAAVAIASALLLNWGSIFILGSFNLWDISSIIDMLGTSDSEAGARVFFTLVMVGTIASSAMAGYFALRYYKCQDANTRKMLTIGFAILAAIAVVMLIELISSDYVSAGPAPWITTIASVAGIVLLRLPKNQR